MDLLYTVRRPVQHANNCDAKSGKLAHRGPRPAPSSVLLLAYSSPSFQSQFKHSLFQERFQPPVCVGFPPWASPQPPLLPSFPALCGLCLMHPTESSGGMTLLYSCLPSAQHKASRITAVIDNSNNNKSQNRPVSCASFLRRGTSSSWGEVGSGFITSHDPQQALPH